MSRFKSNGHHPAQILWQVGEVGMNAWLLYALLTAGLTIPLIVWTIFEVGMNGWILTTMVMDRIEKKKKKTRQKYTSEGHLLHYQFCNCLADSGECCRTYCDCS